jgi:long-chain acyl-CoA synthetase
MNIANLFVRASRRRADGPAVALGTDVLLTHSALVTRAAAIAGALRTRFGLAPGDRAAVVMSNVPDYVELLLAGWHAGLTIVPANARLHRRELAHILGHAGARVCFVTPDLAETVAPLEGELRLPR